MGDRAREIRERLRGITPGPWKALTCDEAGKLLGFLVSNEQLLARRPEPWYIASMPTLETTEGEDRANAALIAHAPADLEWCLARLDAVTRERDRMQTYWDLAKRLEVDGATSVIEKLDAALKREERLRGHIADALDLLDMGTETGATEVLKEALADEGRE